MRQPDPPSRSLQPMQVIGSALRMRSSAEDSALVVTQHREPRTDIGDMVIVVFGRETEIGTQERRPPLGDEFFMGIAFIAKALRPASASISRSPTSKSCRSRMPRSTPSSPPSVPCSAPIRTAPPPRCGA